MGQMDKKADRAMTPIFITNNFMTILKVNHIKYNGFTLLEVLMVVLIVGILSTMVLLTMNPFSDDRQVKAQTESLDLLINQLANDAVIKNIDFGLQIKDSSIQVLCLTAKKIKWEKCPDIKESYLAIEDIIQLKVSELSGNSNIVKNDSLDITAPDILLLSSGEATPVILSISSREHPDVSATINIDELARTTVTFSSDEKKP